MWQGTLSIFAGILYLAGFSTLPDSVWLQFLPAILLFSFFNQQLRLAGFFLAGFLWALLFAHHVLHDTLPENIEKKDVLISGKVLAVQTRPDGQQNLIFKIDSFINNNSPIHFYTKVKINWYPPTDTVSPGEYWQFLVRLKRPHSYRNPGSMDYEAYLFSKGIRATGYVRQSTKNQLLKQASWYDLVTLRHYLVSKIKPFTEHLIFAGQIQALTVGLKANLTKDDWALLRNTGTNHLMAISGLHIGLVSSLAYFLGSFFWRLLVYPCYWLPAHRFAVIPAILAASVYAFLAGFTIPTQRALVMVAAFLLPVFFQRHFNPVFSFFFSLLCVLVINPWHILSTGFWLSFSAVAIILYAFSYRPGMTGQWWKYLRVHWVVGLGLIPVLLLTFQQAPLISVLANVIAVPITTLLVVPIALLALVMIFISADFADALFKMTDGVLNIVWQWLDMVAEIGGGLQFQHMLTSVNALLIIFGTLLLLAPKAWPSRWLGLLCFLPIIFYQAEEIPDGEFKLTVLDVGQGLSVIVQTRQHAMVFDTGPWFKTGFNTAETVVLPYLQQQYVNQLDALVISHSDNDHAGGARLITEKLPTAKTYIGGDFVFTGGLRCQRNVRWDWDDVRFEFLNLAVDTGKENNRSCVLHISNATASVLLPADIEAAAEKELVETIPEKLPAQILLAPHHGSKTSSTMAFINAVDPQHVIFPVGYKNRFNFPNQHVRQKYLLKTKGLYSTAEDGMVQFLITNNSQSPVKLLTRYRLDAARFWHSNIISPKR